MSVILLNDFSPLLWNPPWDLPSVSLFTCHLYFYLPLFFGGVYAIFVFDLSLFSPHPCPQNTSTNHGHPCYHFIFLSPSTPGTTSTFVFSILRLINTFFFHSIFASIIYLWVCSSPPWGDFPSSVSRYGTDVTFSLSPDPAGVPPSVSLSFLGIHSPPTFFPCFFPIFFLPCFRSIRFFPPLPCDFVPQYCFPSIGHFSSQGR